MTQLSKPTYLNDTIALLIKHFGGDKVRAAIKRELGEGDPKGGETKKKVDSRHENQNRPTIPSVLAELRQTEPEKYELLSNFFEKLKNEEVLRDSQDIRNFTQLFGFKQIEGKSRRDLLQNLMHLLLTIPIEQLRLSIRSADGISHDERRRGFSVLTDKLIGRG
jgi:hypothetical protein